MNALVQAFSKENLLKCWRRHKSRFARKTSPGVDGISKTQFANHIDAEAEEISREVRDGTFRYSKLKPIPIPKGDGKIRLINVPTIRDRFVQRVVIDFIVENYRTRWKLPKSFSSMGGDSEGVQQFLKEIARVTNREDFVVRADLSKYFDTIDRDLMKERVRKLVRHRSFHHIIESAIDCETRMLSQEEIAIFNKAGLIQNKGIRQGMPLSPILAYIFLEEVDRSMGDGFFRYVDDLLFVGKDKNLVISEFEKYKSKIEARGLKLHPIKAAPAAKTRLFNAHENFFFLGIKIERREDGNHFLVPSEARKKIIEKIERDVELDKINKHKQKNWTLSTAGKASSLVRDYFGAYGFCENWGSLERQLRENQKYMVRRIVEQLCHLQRNGERELVMRTFGI